MTGGCWSSVAAASTRSAPSPAVELYNPKTKKWSPAAPLPHGRSHHTATLLNDGRVLVVGGTTHEGEDTNNRFAAVAWAEVYDPKKNTWATAASLGEPRSNHAPWTLLNDGRCSSPAAPRPSAPTWRRSSCLTCTGRGLGLASGPCRDSSIEAVRLANGSVVVVASRSNRRGTRRRLGPGGGRRRDLRRRRVAGRPSAQ